MFTIDDYILVSRNGTLFKSSIENFKSMFLPVNDNETVEAITNTIDEISVYILELSSTILNEYVTKNELAQKYESLSSTNAILEDKSILTEEEIEKIISESDLVSKDKAEDAYDKIIDKCDTEFSKVENKIDSNWFD